MAIIILDQKIKEYRYRKCIPILPPQIYQCFVGFKEPFVNFLSTWIRIPNTDPVLGDQMITNPYPHLAYMLMLMLIFIVIQRLIKKKFLVGWVAGNYLFSQKIKIHYLICPLL